MKGKLYAFENTNESTKMTMIDHLYHNDNTTLSSYRFGAFQTLPFSADDY